jgi:putative copper export protein
MTLLMKTVAVLLCFALCGAAAFIALSPRKENQPQKTNVTPVKNREVVGRFWVVS